MFFAKSMNLALAFLIAVSLSATASAAQSNDYRITILNNSDCAYWVFMEQREGNDPMVVEKGRRTSPIILKETGKLYITSPCAPARKVITTQIYPFPTVIFSKLNDGFSTADNPKITAKDVLVTIAKNRAINLSNLGPKQVWEKK